MRRGHHVRRKPRPSRERGPQDEHLLQALKDIQDQEQENPNPLEKEMEARIGKHAKKCGCLYYKFTSPARRAVPDRIIINPRGVVGFLEIKRRGGRATHAQAIEIDRLDKQGCFVRMVDSVEAGEQFINELCIF